MRAVSLEITDFSIKKPQTEELVFIERVIFDF